MGLTISSFIHSLPGLVFYPIILLWSIFYGVTAGIFFKLIAVFENWWAINRLLLILWKRYPQRSYKKYVNSIWATQVRGQPIERADYIRHQVEHEHRKEPFPIFRMATNTIAMLVIAPFMAISGIVEGPVYVYKKHMAIRHQRMISM